MRKTILEIISSYNIEPNDLHSLFILEMIKEASSILNQSSPKEAEMFSHNAINVIEPL
jgi:hypothetical protein